MSPFRLNTTLTGCIATLIILITLPSCGDKAPSGAVNQPPSILKVTAPFFVAVPDSGVAGDDTIFVTALDPEGDIITISLDVRSADGSPVTGALPEQMSDDGSGPDQNAGDNLFTAILSQSVINETGGTYEITFDIRDDQGNNGESFVHRILSGRNFAPVVFNPVFPETVEIPETGVTPFDISIQADDPNGLFDVKQVFLIVTTPAGPSNPLELSDNGDVVGNGDLVASDGVFTVRVEVGPGNTPGLRPLEFFSIDIGGLQSESLLDTLVLVDSN